MSGAMSLGGSNFSFLVAMMDEGWILDQNEDQEEVLTTAGVDGARWRTVSGQHPEYTLTTLVDAADFGAAVVAALAYRQALKKSKLARITLTVPNRSDLFVDAHIKRVMPKPIVGSVTSPSGTNGATVIALWRLQLTDFPQSSV